MKLEHHGRFTLAYAVLNNLLKQGLVTEDGNGRYSITPKGKSVVSSLMMKEAA